MNAADSFSRFGPGD
jgi:hypothetical protein